MATLVSPGVSVTITDESFFIPAAASTVPLFFIATTDEKINQTTGLPYEGTTEHDVIRTITTASQLYSLYGSPTFWEDYQGNPQHGDARNEYGLAALYSFLGIGNRAFVVRANVNLDDDRASILAMWDRKTINPISGAGALLEQITAARIAEYNATNQYIPSDVHGVGTVGAIVPGSLYTDGVYTNVPLVGGTGSGATANITVAGGAVTVVSVVTPGKGYTIGDSLTAATVNVGGTGAGFSVPVATLVDLYKQTVTSTELKSDLNTAMQIVYDKYSFAKIVVRNISGVITGNWFEGSGTTATSFPLDVYANGYDQVATGSFVGTDTMIADWVATGPGSVVATEFTPAEAAQLLVDAATDFQYTVQFLNITSLGANDAARRLAIVTALQATVSSNQDVRAENFEYNLIVCPGYHELVDEMNTLSIDIMEEALVIADTPMDMNPDDVVVWGDSNTSTRIHSAHVAYYYPHGLTSHPFTGKNIMVAASGIALRTYVYSDNQADLWWAPAGTRRGQVSGISQVGFVTGTLGTATTFNVAPLTQGQRDNMYKYTTNLNPITNLPGRGLVVFGQKTSALDASAMDRVSVSRMMKYIKRQLRKNVVSFLFEPNDQLTRNNLKAVVDSFLSGIMHKRGLYDFATVCDDSNNTPDRIDRNELYIDVALKPEKAVEFIYIPIRILATGAAMG